MSILKQVLERDNYKVREETLKPAASPKPASSSTSARRRPPPAIVEVPKDCTVLVIAGPQFAYPPAIVNAIKTYVEGRRARARHAR